MIEKPKKTKKKKVKTPMPDTKKYCVGCGTEYNLEIHHVFGNSSRNASSEYKCVDWLCSNCHRGNNGVHGINRYLDTKLKQEHQERLEKEMTREEFVKLFGRSYL